MEGERTLAEGIAYCNDLALVDTGGTRLERAVMHTVAEVHVCAQAGDVVVGASQARGLGQHVLDACFLWSWSVHNSRMRRVFLESVETYTAVWQSRDRTQVLGHNEASEQRCEDDGGLHGDEVQMFVYLDDTGGNDAQLTTTPKVELLCDRVRYM